MSYTTSIINKYGDSDRVPSDCRTLFDIIDRQGNQLLIDCIAEKVGNTANKFNLTREDRRNLVTNLVNELRDSVLERI